MSIDALLDQILIPRPGGSEGLARVAGFIAQVLELSGADVARHEFLATPYGFQLVWTAALLLLLGYVLAIGARRYGIALASILLTASMLLVEFEFLYSPVSGLLAATESNVVGTFPGAPNGPTVIFSAHYDTATHFGDHFSWGKWGFRQGPATAMGLVLALVGLWRRSRGEDLPRALTLPVAVLVSVPFAAMFWFQTVGPLVRSPSIGALDNGGSVAALLRLSDRLGSRASQAPATVKLVFLAAEEERTLGSRAFAETLDATRPLAVINLESVGASNDLAYIAEDGFALTRYHSPEPLIALLNDVARDLWGHDLPARELPAGTLTDGRSFLARGIPAVTLRAFIGDEFPRGLHSENDSRDRLSIEGVERAVLLMRALVEVVDRNPSLLQHLGGPAE